MKALSKFEKEVDYVKRYPKIRELFTYAGNVKELDVLKRDLIENEREGEKYPKDVVEFFYNERKSSLLRGADISKSEDKQDPDNIDMEGRMKADLLSKTFINHRPNF